MLLRPNPEELPRTTFLTIEAVVVSLSSQPGRPRMVFESGFFQSLATRTVDVNFDFNPYPKLNVVRSLLTCSRLGFSIGPRLVRYITEHSRRVEIEELVEVQRQHYGRVLIDEEGLSHRLDTVADWLRWHPGRPMPLPVESQLTFSQFDLVADYRVQVGACCASWHGAVGHGHSGPSLRIYDSLPVGE
jgi:hypothetical protein